MSLAVRMAGYQVGTILAMFWGSEAIIFKEKNEKPVLFCSNLPVDNGRLPVARNRSPIQ